MMLPRQRRSLQRRLRDWHLEHQRDFPWRHASDPYHILLAEQMLRRTREYDKDDYSVPIGSRFHPERAAIWEPNSPVETTEQWMGAR